MICFTKKIKERIIKHFLIKILLLLFLGTSYLTATHIHFDELEHEEGCEVCVVINNFHGGDISHAKVEIPSLSCNYDEIVFCESYTFTHLPLGYYSTAPPAS